MPFTKHDGSVIDGPAGNLPNADTFRTQSSERAFIARPSRTLPEQSADIVSDGQRVGVKPSAAIHAPEAIKSKLEQSQRTELLENAPGTRAFLGQPEHSFLAGDDISNLTGFEWLVRAPQAAFREGRETVELSQLGFQQLVGNATADDEKRIRTIESRSGRDFGNEGFLESALIEASRTLPTLLEVAKDGIEGGLQGSIGAGSAAALLGQAGPQVVVPEEILTVPGAAATGFAIGSRPGAAQAAFEMEAGLAYREFIAFADETGQPIEPEIARIAAVASGAVNAGLEVFALNTLVKSFPGGEKILGALSRGGIKQALRRPSVRSALQEFAKRYATVWTTETATEIAQEAVVMLAGEIAKDVSEGTFDDMTADEATDRLLETAEKTAQAMTLLAVPGPGANLISDTVKARQAKEQQKRIEALGESAKAAKLRERMPETYRSFVRSVKERGDVESVFIPADRLQNYFQENEIDGDDLAKTLPYLQGQLREALAAGGDVVIPLEDYATHIAPTEMHTDLSRDLRLHAGDMTLNEADAFEAEMADAFDAAALDAERALEADRAQTASGDLVYEDIKRQLVQAGRALEVADKEAAVHRALFSTMAERIGDDAFDLYRRWNVVVRGEIPEQLRNRSVDEMDILIERVKRGRRPSDRDVYGRSLMDFVRERGIRFDADATENQADVFGGSAPRNDPLIGDLRGMDIDRDLKPGQRRALRSDGMALDDLALAAQEAGYFPGRDLNTGDRIDLSPFIEAMRDELAGLNRFFAEENIDHAERDRRDAADALTGELDRRGIDIGLPTEEIKRRLSLEDTPGTEFFALRHQDREFSQPDASGSDANNTVRRGSIRFSHGETVISLFKDADLSTVLHESGHLYLEVLRDLAELPDAPESLKRDWQTALDWLDAADGNAIAREQHEKWARGFEAYLREGKAPSVELQNVFDRFRAWLIRIYREITKLDVEINDDIRGVFDRMLASDREIEIAEAHHRYLPMFDDADAAGMTEAEFASYDTAARRARADANAELTRRAMIDLNRETQAWWKEERARVRDEVAAQIDSQPVYRAMHMMLSGERQDNGKVRKLKLDRQALIDERGPEILNMLPRGGERIYKAEGGVHPDIVAELYGFQSGDALINVLLNTPTRKRAIEAETDRVMRDRHGDMLRDGTIEREALEVVHSDSRANFLATELKVLTRRAGRGVSTPSAVARDAARRMIAAKPVRDAIALGRYAAAEIKAAKEATRALADGDLERTADWKRKQLLNHHLYREALKTRDELDRVTRYLGKFDKKKGRAGLDSDYLDQIDGLLEQYDFRRSNTLKAIDRRKSLAAWVAQQQAAGEPVDIDNRFIEEANLRHYRDMSIDELRALRDAVKNIEHLGKFKDKLRRKAAQRRLSETADDVAETMHTNLKARNVPLETNRTAEKLRRFGRGTAGILFNADTVLREMDGFQDLGPAYRAIKGGVDEAVSEGLIPRQQREAKRLVELFNVYSKKERGRLTATSREIPGTALNLTHAGRLSVALNTGNVENRRALTESGQFTEDQIDAVLETLDERDWKFVQSVWDYIDGFWTEISDAQKRRTGVTPPKVEATPIETRFGEFRGGYYPLRYDRNASVLASEEQVQDVIERMRSGRFAAKHTARGHTKERTGSGGRAVLLDLSVIHSHVDQVITDLEIGDAVADAHRVLGHRTVRRAFEETGHLEKREILDLWLRDVTTGEILLGNSVEAGLRWLRVGFTTSKLAWNVSTAMLQPLGLLQTAVQLGKRDTAAGLKALMTSPWWGERSVFKAIEETSPFMASRSETFNKDIGDAAKLLKRSVLPDSVTGSLFLLIAKAQRVVDAATWLGAHAKGMRDFDGDPRKALRFADRTVARAQASGIFADRTAMERGSIDTQHQQSEFVRTWTALISYFMAKTNVAYERTKRTEFRDPVQVANWATDMALLFTVEAMIAAVIRGNWPDEDEDESLAAFIAGETTKSVAAGLPVLREVSSAVQGFDGGGVIGAVSGELAKASEQLSQGEVDAALLKSLNRVGGTFFRYPSSQINKTGEAIYRAYEGEDVGLLEYLLGPHFDR